MEKIVMHIDVNNAFLSWTAVYLLKQGYNEDIRTIEAVIGGDKEKRSGIVLAKSPPAKQKGIKTAETLQEAKRKCPHLKIFPPNHKLYKEESKKLFNLLSKYTPDIEVASIDECYIDYGKVKKLYGDELIFAKKIQKEIKDTLGFTVNIGIANNKLCAKMASDFSKPNKIHTLYQEEIKEKMYPLPVENLFGIGKQTAEKLKFLEIETVEDLAKQKEYNLQKTFKNQTKHLIEIANGIDETAVDPAKRILKGISHEITLKKDLTSKIDIYEILSILTEMVRKRLRKEEKYAKVVCIILKDNNFKRYSHQKKLTTPINTYTEIYKIAKELVDKFYKNEPIRLVGIRLDDLTSTKIINNSIFEEEMKQITKIKESENIEKIMDNLNEKYGKEIIKRATHIKN